MFVINVVNKLELKNFKELLEIQKKNSVRGEPQPYGHSGTCRGPPNKSICYLSFFLRPMVYELQGCKETLVFSLQFLQFLIYFARFRGHTFFYCCLIKEYVVIYLLQFLCICYCFLYLKY